MTTVNGEVTLSRRWWSSPTDGSFAPVDDVIDVAHQTVTVGVREMAARLNNGQRGFEAVAVNLRRTAQVSLSGEQLRLLVEAEGRQVLEQQRSGQIPPAFQATDCQIPAEAQATGVVPPRTLKQALGEAPRTRLYVGVDGVMVPVITENEKLVRRKKTLRKRRLRGRPGRPLPPRKRGWTSGYREFQVIEFHDETGQRSHQTLSSEKRTSLGIQLRRDAGRLKFLEADERISNVDGASWIRTQLETSAAQLRLDGLGLDGLGLDFWHFAENIHRARRVLWGDAEEGTRWAKDLGDTFLNEGFEAGWDKLLACRQGYRSGKKRQALGRLVNDISERKDMLNFPEFRARGWQIGSGPTEARCKTTTYRLKAPGCRWNIRNAEAIAALTTLADSGQWDKYWNLRTTLAV